MAQSSLPCSYAGCENKINARGYCSGHYRLLKLGLPLRPLRHKWPPGTECGEATCQRKAERKGFCSSHSRHFIATGETRPLRKMGKRGRGTVTPTGYRMHCLTDDPLLGTVAIMEHRLVMSRILGRALRRDETVHHKNGDRLDNRPDNLELWSSFQPPGQRVEDKLDYAIEILRRYKPDALV